jgi:hypothetical protein
MSKKYPGLYLYYDWVDALEMLSPEIAMKIIINLRRFAESNIEPEEIRGPELLIQNMMLAQLKRSKQTAESLGKTYKRKKEAPMRVTDTVSQEELEREANDEEKQMWERVAAKREAGSSADDVSQAIERARQVLRDLKIG